MKRNIKTNKETVSLFNVNERKLEAVRDFIKTLRPEEDYNIKEDERFEEIKATALKELSSNEALRMVNYEGVIKGMHKAKIEVKT